MAGNILTLYFHTKSKPNMPLGIWFEYHFRLYFSRLPYHLTVKSKGSIDVHAWGHGKNKESIDHAL